MAKTAQAWKSETGEAYPGAADDMPTIIDVSPEELCIGAVTDALRRKAIQIAASWNWRDYEIPVCVQVRENIDPDGAYEVIKNTAYAVAARAHPAIGLVPIMVVASPVTKTQAA